MAKGDTKTNQYLDIAANGTRADLPTDTCCETRSQTLIREVAERIMDVEDEVEEIKNNPDVVDIVATYADLQAYDTQHLTDKDIIRVLQDETHDGESTYYRYNKQSDTWTYVGESKQYEDFVGTDGTAAGEAGLVPAPATTDAGKFLSASGLWEEVAGGGVTELTTADYNWPTANPDGIALWKLDTGIYKIADGVKQYRSTIDSDSLERLIIAHDNGYQTAFLLIRGADASMKYYDVQKSTGVVRSMAYIGAPVDALGSTSSVSALSANQGRVLKDLIDSLVIKNAGAPTTSTVGTVGKLYEDTTNGDLYICTDATNPYVWEEVGSGGGGPTVVQTTGTSTTDVMSQNATTSMVFKDPGTNTRVRIGAGADNVGQIDGVSIGKNANDGIGLGKSYVVGIGSSAKARAEAAVAIGMASSANGKGSIALGTRAQATSQGEMNIGTDLTSYGYNSSNYRLLTGLYDPQSAHDAATKGYVDGTTETYTIATSDWSTLSASSPYDYQATVTATYTIGANTIAELLNDDAVSFATYGFAIGSISSQSVTIYSIGQPSASVSLKINYKG